MKRKIFLLFVLVISIIFGSIGYVKYNEKQEKIEKEMLEKEKKDLKLSKLKEKYNSYVITIKETDLYKKNDDGYLKVARINNNVELMLEEIKLNYEVDYFKVKGLGEEYYIYYEDVMKIDNMSLSSDRYKRYIVFNKNVKTDNDFKLYNEDGNYLNNFYKEMNFSIIYKDGDKVYVEYCDKLYYLLLDDIVEEYDNKNTNEKIGKRVRTLVYHRIYDPETEECDQVICHKEDDFDSHMKYLNDNNYLSLTMKELELFIDGNLQIPVKSVVITIDDGTMDKRAIPILGKYKINASLFLVTSRFKKQDYIDFTSDYLELHSHTHNMHWAGECSGYGSQGGGILCFSTVVFRSFVFFAHILSKFFELFFT